jgi:hypothetical protein
MEPNKEIEKSGEDLFIRYSEDINPAYERAVREALLKHKRAGNSVVVERDGKMVILQPEEIEMT